ncbi:MAG: T9SS type A sorting domain-containing protein [Flavobacteriales bacterium]
MKSLFTLLSFLLISQSSLTLAQGDKIIKDIFPNPVENVMNLTFSSEVPDKIYNWRVMDYQGRVFKQGSFYYDALRETEQLDLYDVTAGVYVLHVESEGKETVIRFIKQ